MSTIFLNMLNSLKPFHCPSCNHCYSNKDSARLHTVARCPLILSCGHTACETCIRSAAKSFKSIVCEKCKTSTDLSDGEIISQFPPDLHVLGVLCANLKQSLPSLKMKGSQNLPKQMQSKENTTVFCETCNQIQAVWRCDKCEQNYCDYCFDQIHKRVKAMRKHEGKKICAEVYNTMIQEGCVEHKRPIEFFCEDDNQLACSYCVVMGDHKGHIVVPLIDKNKSCAEDLLRVLEEVQILQKRLKYSEHKIDETIPMEKVDISDLMKQVHEHFHTLHALLQLRETKLITYLEEISCINSGSLEKMRNEISVYEKDLKSVMRDAESVIKNPCLAVSAADIIKKLQECKTLPCHFVPISEKSDWTVGIELDFDPDLEATLSQHGKITADIKPKYCLKSSSEIPEDSLDLMNDNLSIPDTESVISTLDTFSEDSLSMASPSGDSDTTVASLKFRDFTALQIEKVVISHIKSPTSFYAQRCSESRKLRNLSDCINRWCMSSNIRKERLHEVEKGDLYLVQYSNDQSWYRGRVLEVLEPVDIGGDGDKEKSPVADKKVIKNKECRVKILYIDYGNMEIAPISRLRNIQTRFLNLPGMARECSLWNITPNNMDNSQKNMKWSEEATRTFVKFVGKRPLNMQIIEERNNILYVDLSQLASDDISDDAPVSVRDALVFLDLGCFPSGNVPIRQSKSGRHYLPPEQLLANVNISAIISHVNSPSLFYVQQMSTARYLSELIFDMQNAYNSDINTMLHGVYVPFVGMICAAQFSLDKQWYRAEVINLPGGSMVQVQYVDFGNTEVIHHKCLRKLFDKYCKLCIQAIPCTLADVACRDEKLWTKEAKQWLTKIGSKKQLTLKSLGIEAGEKLNKVILYDTEDEFEVCINALMVEEGLAVSSGPLSKVVRNRKESPVKVHKAAATPLPDDDLDLVPPAVEAKSPVKKVEIFRPAAETKNQVKVYVSCIESPGLFYIRLADMEGKLKLLMEELQKVYRDFEGEIPEFTEGSAYAVYSQIEKQWYRGSVLSKLADDKVQVRFVDYGFTEDVPKKNLRKLMEKFCVDESFAVRCHLSGILPAGDSQQWSYVSCDAFRQLVLPHEFLYLTKKGNIDKEIKSLPSDLIVEELVRGGALEPTKYVTSSIISQLIERGVALPIRKLNKQSAPSSPASSDTDSTVTSEKNYNLKSPPQIEKPKSPLKPKFRWKPAVPPVQREFMGLITNIGEDGSIHLHVVHKGSSHVDMIKKAMQCKYSNSAYEYLRIPPAIGEACMAKFQLDKLWYRAEVLSTYIDKVKVTFVDYGNTEIVPLTDIRTDIILADFPRQCLEFNLPDIKPATGNKWTTRVLDFLHETLVEQVCQIEVLGEPDERNIIPSKINTPHQISVSELLLSMNEAVPATKIFDPTPMLVLPTKIASPKEEIIEEENESVNIVFKSATKFPEEGYFPVCVTQVFEPDVICVQWLEIEEPKCNYEKLRNKELKEFLQLTAQLREEADSFPEIEDPMPGMACCAKYGLDDIWYRCEITDIVEDGYKVLYVDYGNSEVTSADRLRKPPNHFLQFPVQVHVCKLHGIKPVNDTLVHTGNDWDPKITEFLSEKFSEKGIFAKVMVPGKIPELQLYIKNEAGEFESAYKELVEEGVISIENS